MSTGTSPVLDGVGIANIFLVFFVMCVCVCPFLIALLVFLNVYLVESLQSNVAGIQ